LAQVNIPCCHEENMSERLMPPAVDCSRGAPFGRPSFAPEAGSVITHRIHLIRIRTNGSGYDIGGAYWGLRGAPIWWAKSEEANMDFYFNAWSRDEAKHKLIKKYPGIRFLR
jgi:hypothetical protein